MPVRDTGAQALTPWGSAVGAGHGGRDPSFVDEHESGWIELTLPLAPSLTLLDNVRTLLLAGVRGFF